MQENMNRKATTQKAIREFVIFIVICALVATTAFYVGRMFFESWPIVGSSMEPNIHDADKVLVVKTKRLKYGDIIIFRTEASSSDAFNGKYLIKRVIGMPGDKMEISYSGTDNAWHVYRNGEIVDESFIKETIRTYNVSFTETVPEGKYFVLGDNRNNSHDSHIQDFYADEDAVVGKAFVRFKSAFDFSFLAIGDAA